MRSSRRSGLSRAAVLVSLVALLLTGMPTQPLTGGGWPGLSAVAGWFADLMPDTASVARAAEAAGTSQRQAPGAAAVRREGEPSKRVRELVEQRTANGKVFAMSNGQRQVELSSRPRHYQNSQGAWREIDTTVRKAPHKGFVFANTSNRFTTRFSTRSDKLVKFKASGKHITLGLPGDKRTLSPVVKGSTVTYADALVGADLRYEVTPSAVKEKLVLHKAPAKPVWRFSMRMGGVAARELPGGAIGFFAKGAGSSNGPPLFVMPAPFMYDSAKVEKSTHGGAVSQKVTQSVEQQGANITITLRADSGWLNSGDRVYPVMVDPTIKIAPTPTTSQDVQIWSDTPDRNDADTYQLSVGTDAWGAARSLLRFDTSMVPDGNARGDDDMLGVGSNHGEGCRGGWQCGGNDRVRLRWSEQQGDLGGDGAGPEFHDLGGDPSAADAKPSNSRWCVATAV